MKSSRSNKNLRNGLLTGLFIGVLAGLITSRFALWVPIGLAMGFCFKVIFDEMDKSKR